MKRKIIKLFILFIPIQKWRHLLRNKYLKTTMIEFKKDKMLLENILSGEYNTISDTSMRNMQDIFESKCILPKKHLGNYINLLFKNTSVFSADYTHSANYIVLRGSGSWSPQPEMANWAVKNHIPIIRSEDGFLRSADTWCNTVVDEKYTNGISFTFSNDVHYFDATKSSLMERLINDKSLTFSSKELARARKCIDFIVKNHLTKYNHQPIYSPKIGRNGVQKILVIDQSYGDFSISKGLANNNTFTTMLETAIKENPQADIIIKTHPDALAKGTERASGYYSGYKAHDNIYTFTAPINPISLLQYCDKVYVCTTQFGFEALMCNKEVHTFGMPFYAGWGLTKDALICERRTNKRTLEEIFYIAYILYSYYVNPDTRKQCEIEEAMDYLLKLRQEYFEEFKIRKDI
ncbi:MAG TPA: hypothetical protein DIC64_02930 [Alphaproteobacteria bacterium]|nr:hypothetical protein [Alphaproteobacteria bacterium]